MYPQETNTNPVVSQPVSAMPQPENNKKRLGSLPIIVIVAVIVLVAIIGFVIYKQTNNPDKIWSSAKTKTSQMVAAQVDALGKVDSNGYDANGNFTIHNSDTASDINGTETGSTNSEGSTVTTRIPVGGNTVAIDTLVKNISGSSNPDAYYRVKGAKSLALIFQLQNRTSDFTANADQIEDKWLVSDHASNQNQAVATLSRDLPLPQAAIQSAASKIKSLNDQYLFSDDSSKAVLTNRHNVGAMKLDKRGVYHYTFAFQPAHFKQYTDALAAALGSKSLTDNATARFFDLGTVAAGLSTVKGTPTADVYVDKGTKAIRKIHIPVLDKKDNYVDFGFSNDDGIKDISYVTLNGNDNDVVSNSMYTLSLNTKNGTYNYGYTIGNRVGQDLTASNVNTTITPRTSALTIATPTGAANINDYSSALGGVLNGLFDTSGETAQ